MSLFGMLIDLLTGGRSHHYPRRPERDLEPIPEPPLRPSLPIRPVFNAPAPPAPRPLPAAPLAPQVLRGPCWVIDGDTIVIGSERIRIAGIDAPELDQPWGQKSKWAMVQLCRNQIVRAELVGELSHDRHVAVCTLADGRDLAAELVKMGLAIDWPKFSGGRYRCYEPPGVRKKLWRCDARQKGRFPPPQTQC